MKRRCIRLGYVPDWKPFFESLRLNGIPVLRHPRNHAPWGSRLMINSLVVDALPLYCLVREQDLEMIKLISPVLVEIIPPVLIPRGCPFDGGPGISGETDHSTVESRSYYAGCTYSDCIAFKVAYDFSSEESAVLAWNMRSSFSS
ncbi:MAG: hypothetical protein EOO77_21505 [Oxalobacteraceae bacterium]|nr:MAG: hypothetical protein EOO77_21505 [Oxalobacteraceae bacterium]